MVPEERRIEERIVYFRPRAILVVLGIILAATAIIALVFLAWHIITWILVAIFLTLALNPAVEFFQQRGLGRTVSSLIVFLLALISFAALGALLIPPLVDQITEFVDAVPGFVDELTAGRGPLGFLQDEYQIVDKIEEAIEDQGAGGILGVTNVGLAVARGVVSIVVGVVTIAFLTIFMLLEGPKLVDRFEGSLPETMKPRWHRVSRDIYRTVGGYVGGNLLISLIAGIGAAIVLFAVGSKLRDRPGGRRRHPRPHPARRRHPGGDHRRHGLVHRARLGQGADRRRSSSSSTSSSRTTSSSRSSTGGRCSSRR